MKPAEPPEECCGAYCREVCTCCGGKAASTPTQDAGQVEDKASHIASGDSKEEESTDT